LPLPIAENLILSGLFQTRLITEQRKIFQGLKLFFSNWYYKLQRKAMRFYSDSMRVLLLVHFPDFSPAVKPAPPRKIIFSVVDKNS